MTDDWIVQVHGAIDEDYEFGDATLARAEFDRRVRAGTDRYLVLIAPSGRIVEEWVGGPGV